MLVNPYLPPPETEPAGTERRSRRGGALAAATVAVALGGVLAPVAAYAEDGGATGTDGSSRGERDAGRADGSRSTGSANGSYGRDSGGSADSGSSTEDHSGGWNQGYQPGRQDTLVAGDYDDYQDLDRGQNRTQTGPGRVDPAKVGQAVLNGAAAGAVGGAAATGDPAGAGAGALGGAAGSGVGSVLNQVQTPTEYNTEQIEGQQRDPAYGGAINDANRGYRDNSGWGGSQGDGGSR